MSLSGALAELQHENADRIQALASEGVSFDPLMLLKARLDVVTDFLVAAATALDIPYSRDTLEMGWETSVAEMLDEAQAQVDAAKKAGGYGHGTQLSIADSQLILPN